MFTCKLLTVWYTVRYGYPEFLNGLYLSGHDLDYTGEVCHDHWHMVCKRCGMLAASEVGPSAKPIDLDK